MFIYINWQMLKLQKQQVNLKNNQIENKKESRIEHQYKLGVENPITHQSIGFNNEQKSFSPTEEPYNITKVYRNGLVEINHKGYYKRIAILHIFNHKNSQLIA